MATTSTWALLSASNFAHGLEPSRNGSDVAVMSPAGYQKVSFFLSAAVDEQRRDEKEHQEKEQSLFHRTSFGENARST